MRHNTTPEQRVKRCIMLNYWSVKDISLLLDISPSTIRTRMQKGIIQASLDKVSPKMPMYCTTPQLKAYIKYQFGNDAPILKTL